jgi:hypothetical protein
VNKYNTAFFSLLENTFITLKSRFDEDVAIDIFTEIMEKGLRDSYGTSFIFRDTSEFVRLVSQRDASVGLKVEFPCIQTDKLVYRFYTDPMPRLNGIIDYFKLDAVYMNFKIGYILGNDWSFSTTKHIWLGDECSEHIIVKI